MTQETTHFSCFQPDFYVNFFSGAQLCFNEWCSEELDKRESPKIFADNDGDLIFYFDRKLVGSTVITRLFDPDGNQDIRASLVKKVYIKGMRVRIWNL